MPALQPSASGFAITVLGDPLLGDPPDGAIGLKVDRSGGKVVASVIATGAGELKYMYCTLTYDPATYTPDKVEHSGALASRAEDALLTLDIASEPGVIHLGQLLADPMANAGFAGDAVLAKVTFTAQPFPAHAVSVPPVTQASATQLHWDAQAKSLSWGHCCQGDYNQDGLVSVNDLTPLGVHYLAEGPFDEDSALAVVDGNSDGLVTVNDITPIGQNFNCNVEGYAVFADGDLGNLPPTNDSSPAIEPYDYVPFSEAQGDKLIERLTFVREYPELDPDIMVWVRPVSDDLFGTPSRPQISGLGMWHVGTVASFAPGSRGTDGCLLEVNGLPAVCQRTIAPNQLIYQRALDPIGSQWGPEVVVDASGDPGHFSSMRIVAGNPAIAYYDWAAGDLKYCRAIDANGTTWGAPVTVDAAGQVGFDCHLIVANGNPAICYQDLTNYAVKYVRANNTAGSQWGAPVTVANNGAQLPPGTGTSISAAIAGANPAIAYFDNNSGDLHFIRAGDADGTTWGSYVKVNQSVGDTGRYCSLFVVDGRPAVAYLSDGVLAYTRAIDALGATWGQEVVIDNSGFNASGSLDASLCVNHGKPAISYYSGTTAHDLMYVTAVDAAGSTWCAPYSVDGPDQVGSQSCLANIGSNPAISYYDENNDDLKFAILVSANNQAPVAQLAVDKTSAKTGQNFGFDASGSTDSDGSIVLYEWDWLDDGVFEQSTGTTPTAMHAYEEPGDYTPHVRVTDDDGAVESAGQAVHVTPNELPVADLIANPTWGNPPFTVNFDASGSYDPDGTIVNYEWDWNGDGNYEACTDNIPTWSWIYEEPGDFEAKVRVTDDCGGFGIEMEPLSGNHGPVAVGRATPSNGAAPFTVSLDSTGSFDKDGTIDGVWWDIHDDGTDEYSGTATGTWQTTMIWNGAVKARLRVRDNGGAYGTNLVTINVNGGWHVSTLDAPGDVGWYNSLALINNQPGVSYFNYTNGTLKYIRAQDGYGYAWYQPQTLGVIGDITSYACYGTSLAWINGSRAGIVFSAQHPSYPNRDFILASNAEGNAWNPFTALMPNVGPNPDLMVVASNPAFASFDGINLLFTRASDATGASWNAPVTVSPGIGNWSSSSCSLEIVQGTPAIAYCSTDATSMRLMYVRCSDAAGLDWTEPVVVDSVGDPGETCSLAVINGRPAIAYVATESGGSFEIRYKRASSTDGSSWPAGFVQILLDGREVAGLEVVNGNPAIGMRKCTGAEVMYARASDSNGNTWPAPVTIDNSDDNLGYGSHQCDMIVINDHPAISYCHSVDSALKYAVWE